MKLTYKTPTKLVITLTDLLSRNEKNFSDITDVLFFIKENRSQADGDSVVSKTIGGGITLVDETIEVSITATDFGTDKLTPRHTFLLCLGVEFNSSGSYIEDYDPKFNRTIEILADKIRT